MFLQSNYVDIARIEYKEKGEFKCETLPISKYHQKATIIYYYKGE